MRLTPPLPCTGSTWQYLSSERHNQQESQGQYHVGMLSNKEKSRNQIGERERRNPQTGDRDLWGINERKPCSETELHAIKTAFGAIEFLWRDISMGGDSISVACLKSIHQQLGEIGSELFRRIFLSRGQLIQVN
jgi:hypothetical protein